MSEIKKIGMYTTDEILEHLTEGEGRGFLGRSMYDAIYFKIEELENQLQQKENIIKEVREDLHQVVKWYTENKHNEDTIERYLVVDYGTTVGKINEIIDKINKMEDK